MMAVRLLLKKSDVVMTSHMTDVRTICRWAVFLLFLCSANGSSEVKDEGDIVNAVRCRVRCLSLLQRNLDPDVSHVPSSVTLLNCLQEADCEACLRPCNQPFVSVNLCEEACRLPKHDQECQESCQFLKQVNNIRPGRCPPETQVTGFAALCVKGCDSDADCESRLKCCSNSCGWTCQQPTHMFDGNESDTYVIGDIVLLLANKHVGIGDGNRIEARKVSLHKNLGEFFQMTRWPSELGIPNVPDRPIIRERLKAGSLELRWNSVGANSSGPILYIVESRYNIGQHENEAEMTPWHQIVQTTGTSTAINDITPGHWYQFRVTAVNIYGSQGGSLPTVGFTLSREPRKPGPPTNVTEGDTLIMGGKVAVNLHWLPPKKTDLPVSRYKLFWSNRPKNPATQLASLREYRQVVTGDQMMFQIPDLEPDTTYFVQIQAICQYGETRLKSEKVSLHVTTYPLPRSDQHLVGLRTVQPSNTIRQLPTPSTPVELMWEKPVYQNGILKANITWSIPETVFGVPEIDRVFVYWSPEACIADSFPDDGLAKVMSGNTQDSFFAIHDLRFDCRYLVRVQSVTNQGVLGAMSHLSISTPACFEVTVIGKIKPDCPTSALRIPDEPSNVQHSFFISNADITARLSWNPPLYDSSQISGYRIHWGQTTSAELTFSDPVSTLTKVLPKDAKTFVLNNLHEGTTYLVRMQALSRAGPGRYSAFQFTTPLLQINPQDREYISVGRGESSDDDDDDDGMDYVIDLSVVANSNHQDASRHQIVPRSTAASRTFSTIVRLPFHVILLLVLSRIGC